ncbi:hypothetical protein VOLCADRAFT_67081 [Volvox carteri f. nagariensis]|uniref:Ion transport domain-containing protein n=1 Tax=Volvox carteri f. nagariensis TaxID=3068 RepID=D8UD20_VOLCA|nr:uncharacterized protein VOLCADRAFT_67081 [Volvox carteri f. nagariensis]EFJ42353.1 hypothetical protein VOLCADRAFT_67081 [Volvox carteri f. nagariensis]|eukprot:XP_002956586.1 hypothetical protein VOLCADRAFT_67081 [Volvox carteri f. nagariensis]
MKSLAHNFALGPGAYLKNGWNWIDLLATASGYVRYLPLPDDSGAGLSGVRAMRALRPLRALSAIPGLRLLVETLLEALPLLLDVIFLLAWVFFVFGIVALNLFMGKLHSRCVWPALTPAEPPPGATGAPADPPYGPGAASPPQQQPQLVPGLENTPCAVGGAGLFKCPDGSSCIDINTNPNFGYTSFDNFGAAAFCIFQMLTLDGWTSNLLWNGMQARGTAAVLYFVTWIILGNFVLLTLFLAILITNFQVCERVGV